METLAPETRPAARHSTSGSLTGLDGPHARKELAARARHAAADAKRLVVGRASGSAWAMESVASGLLSTAALMLLGRRENGSPFAPLNATSHIVWGESAAQVDKADWKHTAVGQALHHASAFFWGALFELLQARRARPTAVGVLTDAAVTTAVAAVVDFKLVPDRLTPGFEKRLSRKSLTLAYGALALGLVIGGQAALRRRAQR